MWLIDKMALMNPHYRLMCLILCWPVLVSAQDPSTDIAIGGSNLLPDAMNPNLFIIGEAGGTRPGAGVNLIHSLDRFDLNSADTARFTADPLPTDNIIARVTGGDISTIWGTIEMDVAGANLFFLNPAGIVFGPTATLNVQGGFHASTADTVSLDNGMGNTLLAFSGDAALAMAHPVAFGFLNAPMGTITVDGVGVDGVLVEDKFDSLLELAASPGFTVTPSGTLYVCVSISRAMLGIVSPSCSDVMLQQCSTTSEKHMKIHIYNSLFFTGLLLKSKTL